MNKVEKNRVKHDVNDERRALSGFDVCALSRLNCVEPPEFLDRLMMERASDELRAYRARMDERSDGLGLNEPNRLPPAEFFAYAAGISFWVIEVAQALVRLVTRASGS